MFSSCVWTIFIYIIYIFSLTLTERFNINTKVGFLPFIKAIHIFVHEKWTDVMFTLSMIGTRK